MMLGKIEGRRRKGRQDETVGWHHHSMDMSLNKLRELMKDREEPGMLQSMGWKRVRHDLEIE